MSSHGWAPSQLVAFGRSRAFGAVRHRARGARRLDGMPRSLGSHATCPASAHARFEAVGAEVVRRAPVPRRHRPGAGGVQGLMAGSVLVSATVALHATYRVQRLRSRGAEVTPLVHHLDLPGRFPPRWLVVVGDSAAAGHGLHDAEEAIARRIGRGLHEVDGRATAVRSAAVDGATTADVLERQIEAAQDAEVVIVGVGVNDALRATRTRAEVAGTTARLLRALEVRAAEGADIILVTCPDLSVAPGLPPVLRPIVGRRCRTIARAQEEVARSFRVVTLDLERDRLPPEVFGPDGFHPGAVGHARLATRIVELLRARDDHR